MSPSLKYTSEGVVDELPVAVAAVNEWIECPGWMKTYINKMKIEADAMASMNNYRQQLKKKPEFIFEDVSYGSQ